MLDKNLIATIANSFNGLIATAKHEEKFEDAINDLNQSHKLIEEMEGFIKQMKQENHDLTQDVYNKFKDKGYVKTIKF